MKFRFVCLILAAVLALPSHKAQAVSIDYIFTGSGAGTLGGSPFDGDFNFTILADTTGVAGANTGFVTNNGNATFISGALSTTLTGARAVINSGNINFVTLQFGQAQASAPFFVSEAIVAPAFATYNLDTPFPLTGPFTGDGLSVQPLTYLTAAGDLDFSAITSLSFEAIEPSNVPLPAGLPMMMAALGELGLLVFARRKAVRVRS